MHPIQVNKTYVFAKSGNLVRVIGIDIKRVEARVERVDSGKRMIVPVHALLDPSDPVLDL